MKLSRNILIQLIIVLPSPYRFNIAERNDLSKESSALYKSTDSTPPGIFLQLA